MSIRIVKDTKGAGLNELGRRLAALNKQVLVGVPEGKSEPDGASMAEVAAFVEFGSADGTVSERSYLRAGIRENLDDIKRVAADGARAELNGRISATAALDLVGIAGASAVKQKMVEGPFEPNAPSTIRQKGSDKPTIDSASLRQTITHVIAGATP